MATAPSPAEHPSRSADRGLGGAGEAVKHPNGPRRLGDRRAAEDPADRISGVADRQQARSDTPARATSNPAIIPAGPPPTIRTSAFIAAGRAYVPKFTKVSGWPTIFAARRRRRKDRHDAARWRERHAAKADR